MSNPYDEPTETCPYCKDDMYAEFADVGVGSVQCAPYHCQTCGASEIGPELEDWYHKDRNGHLLMLTAKRVYIPFLKKKMRTFQKPILKPGHPFSEKELETGYYQGRISPYANTIDGNLVNMEVARAAYEIGILDEKDLQKNTLTRKTKGLTGHDPNNRSEAAYDTRIIL